jgi:uncharacterized protein (TIGR02145 family)
MKTIYFFSILFSISTLQAQNYVITFSASGAAQTLDSVYIENLTTGANLTINGNDTLNIIEPVSISKIDRQENSIRIFPNPVNDFCTIEIFSPKDEVSLIQVADITGKTILNQKIELSSGLNSFNLSVHEKGLFVLRVLTNSYLYSDKLVVTENSSALSFVHVTKYSDIRKCLKKEKILNVIEYLEGDILLFIGTSGEYSTIITSEDMTEATINFELVPCKDAAMNTYTIVKIGEQYWMAKNLKTNTLSDGTQIPYITDASEWSALQTAGYSWYNNDYENTGAIYGGLYNFHSVATGKLCPSGWHVPSDDEWGILELYIANEGLSGGAIKETGFAHWSEPNGDASNATGFTSLPAGYRTVSGNFTDIGTNVYFWSSTEYFDTVAWERSIQYLSGAINRSYSDKKNGFPIRCVKD